MQRPPSSRPRVVSTLTVPPDRVAVGVRAHSPLSPRAVATVLRGVVVRGDAVTLALFVLGGSAATPVFPNLRSNAPTPAFLVFAGWVTPAFVGNGAA